MNLAKKKYEQGHKVRTLYQNISQIVYILSLVFMIDIKQKKSYSEILWSNIGDFMD